MRSCRAVLARLIRVAWAQYEATAPEIPQLCQPSMEPELAIVVVETGKAPSARKWKFSICIVWSFESGQEAIRNVWIPSANLKYEPSA